MCLIVKNEVVSGINGVGGGLGQCPEKFGGH